MVLVPSVIRWILVSIERNSSGGGGAWMQDLSTWDKWRLHGLVCYQNASCRLWFSVFSSSFWATSIKSAAPRGWSSVTPGRAAPPLWRRNRRQNGDHGQRLRVSSPMTPAHTVYCFCLIFWHIEDYQRSHSLFSEHLRNKSFRAKEIG